MTPMLDTFLEESYPRQLGAIATTLARISSSAPKPSRVNAVAFMLDESIQFIEQILSAKQSQTPQELKDLQIMLSLWREGWNYAQANESQRKLLSFQAKKWSDQVLDYSGLLNNKG